MDFSRIIALKGEFEAEGLSRASVAAEAAFAARHGLSYLVKIGGCEAMSDMNYLMEIGIRSLVAPMIESPFAMRKYQAMLPEDKFDHIGVTIETVDAVRRIEEILDAGTKLTEVTVGRTDLTASYGGTGVDSPETMDMFRKVAAAAKSRGLKTTMGGSVSRGTRELLRADPELAGMVACVETRKCVMPIDKFLEDGSLHAAFEVEEALLERIVGAYGPTADRSRKRAEQIRARL